MATGARVRLDAVSVAMPRPCCPPYPDRRWAPPRARTRRRPPMTASEKPLRSVWRRERGAPPVSDPPSEQIPPRLVPEPAVAEEPPPSILGFPAEAEPADSVFAARPDGPTAGAGTPDSSPRLVYHRRVDGTGGLLL